MTWKNFFDLLPGDMTGIQTKWTDRGESFTLAGAWTYGEDLLHVRGEAADGAKSMPWFRRDGSSWKRNLDGLAIPLYGVDSIRTDAPVFFVEGEKPCAALHRIGIPAVAIAGTASANAVDLSPLDGQEVILWADADEPGAKAMDKIGERLGRDHRRVDPNNLGMSEKADAADLVAAMLEPLDMGAWDGTCALCREMEIDGLADAVAGFKGKVEAATVDIRPEGNAAIELFELPENWMDLSLPQREFLFENVFPRNAVSFLAAAGGMSKSYLSLIMMCSLCIGRELLLGFRPTGLMRVIALSLEDDRNEILRRLQSIAHQYNFTSQEATLIQDRLAICTPEGSPQFFTIGPGGAVLLGGGLKQVQAMAADYRPDAVFLDPLSALLSGVDENANATAQCTINLLRSALPDSTIVVLAHLAKSDRLTATNGTRGAGAWQDGCRQALTIRPLSASELKACDIESNEQDRFFTLLSTKQNYGSAMPQMFFERVDGVPVPLKADERMQAAAAATRKAIEDSIICAMNELEPDIPLSSLCGKCVPPQDKAAYSAFKYRVIELSGIRVNLDQLQACLKHLLEIGKLTNGVKNGRKVVVL